MASIHITEHLVKIFLWSQGNLGLLFPIHPWMHYFDTLSIAAITWPNVCWSFKTTEHKILLSSINHCTINFQILTILIVFCHHETKTISRNSAFPLSFISCRPHCQTFIREIWNLAVLCIYCYVWILQNG